MDVKRVLHMTKGDGPNSYAKNSLLQRTMTEHARPIIEESAREVYDTLKPECFMMAEMGCSSGPNALLLVSGIINLIDEASRSMNQQPPQFGVFFNDLSGNDFNALFNLLPSFEQAVEEEKESSFSRLCFVSGIPKSFYGRVFPDRFLHFVHSSSSVHWLSQVPRGLVNENEEALNKGNIYIAKTSPPEVHMAYYAQFKMDFTLFLRSRSKEVVSDGRMVLVLLGSSNSHDPDSIYALLGSTLNDMVKGVIDKENLDKFNMPFYFPTIEEVGKLVEAEGSFFINKLKALTIDWSVDTSRDLEFQAKFVAKTTRAVTEPLLATAFRNKVIDDLFQLFETRVKERIAGNKAEHLNIVVSVTRKE